MVFISQDIQKFYLATNVITMRDLDIRVGADREGWSRSIPELAVGGAFKEALSEPGTWSMGMGGFGETLPYQVKIK